MRACDLTASTPSPSTTLPEQLEDHHVVLAQSQTRSARIDDLLNEVGPVLWPFVFQHLTRMNAPSRFAEERTCTRIKFNLLR